MNDQTLLFLAVAPALEPMLTDLLLEKAPGVGFTTVPAFGHGVIEAEMSVTERIAGRVRRVQFEVICSDQTQTRELLALVQEAFPDAGIHYWAVPVLTAGILVAAPG